MAALHLLTVALLVTISTAQDYRLPAYYSPSNYDISLTLPENVFTTENAKAYEGKVTVTFTVSSEDVSEVVLHASATHINVTAVTLVATDAEVTYNVTGWSVNSTTNIFTITLNNSLNIGTTYELTLDYDGQLSITDMYGFYKSSYTDSTNTTYYLVTTQMESTYARRTFPCFDEPSYKATFKTSLTYPTGLSALANTAVNSTTSNTTDLTTTTVFNPTPKMSTYLVAFIISSFTSTEGDPVEGSLPHTVSSRNETASTRGWALEVAPKAVDSLNSYTGVNYSTYINKLDQVAIPDFSAGAMENWGLITYRERALLYDDNETSNSYKQYIAAVIAHELGHHWFGNIVTCKWWSEIFLNEGFATFFEYFTTHELYPDYEMDKQFVIKTVQYVLESDASSTESLRQDASTPSEISARFGSVSYDKGGSVLRMVEHILGTTAWKTGLNSYLTQFALSSTEPDDLWAVLNASASTANLPVSNLSTVMANWINYPGFPVVTVSLTSNTTDGTTQQYLSVSQERFVYNNKTSSNVTWYVPITFITSQSTTFDDTTPVAWLTPTDNLEISLSESVSWIIVNTQQTGYYRVNYDTNVWSSIATALLQTDFSNIPEVNRAQIVSDALNLARGGYITYSQAFNVTQFLANETSYTVWYAAFSGFGYVLKRVGENSTLGQAISNHLSALTSSVISSVSLTTVDHSRHVYTLNQVQAQSWACKLGNSDCTLYATEQFASFRNSSVRPNKNLRSIVYSYGLKHSTDISADWEFLWNAYLSTSLSTEQVTILAALGSTSNETILRSYLQKTLTDDSGIRSQDYAAVFSAVYTGSSTGVNVALEFFIENYSSIVARYTSMNGVGNILRGIAEQITTEAQKTKLQEFTTSGDVTGTLLDVANSALTNVQGNLDWVETYRSGLNAYYGIQEETTPAPEVTTLAPGVTTLAPGVTTLAPGGTTTPEVTTPGGNAAYKVYFEISLMILAVLVIRL